jgi:hypothetical protein
VSYSGTQGPRVVLQAFVSPTLTGVPASQAILPLGMGQPYFLSLTANTSYYLRAFVDLQSDLIYRAGADVGVIGASTATPTAVFVANTLVTVSTLTLSADTLAPANPYGLTATNAGFGTVFLNWFMPTTNANGSSLIDFATFKLQRSTSSVGPFTTVVTSTSTNFTDANAVVGVSNYYRVVAVDYAGNNSAPSAIIVIQPASGGTISGNLKYTGTATQGVFRVRLSSAVAGTTLAETTLDPFSFTGLYDGVYYVRVFRDLNGDSVHQDGEPGGTIGGIAQPYPINIVSASAFAGSTVPVCDRTSAIFPAAGSAQSYASSISQKSTLQSRKLTSLEGWTRCSARLSNLKNSVMVFKAIQKSTSRSAMDSSMVSEASGQPADRTMM